MEPEELGSGPLYTSSQHGDLKHPSLPSKTWDQLTSPKDYRSIKLITKTSAYKDLSNQVKGYLLSLSRVHILESSQTFQKSLINNIMWPSFSTQPMAVFLKVSPCRVLTQVWILHTPKRKFGALPFRVLDFNHQGANVTESQVPNNVCKGNISSIILVPKKALAQAMNKKLKNLKALLTKLFSKAVVMVRRNNWKNGTHLIVYSFSKDREKSILSTRFCL